jgi:hypothetical protein
MMALNPLAPVTDYQSMLNRIFWFSTASALAAVWLLRRHIPELNSLLAEIDFTIEFGGNKLVPIPGGFLCPALAVGILTRIFRLHARVSDWHARVSDWLGIRECFDVDVVIAELAGRLAIDLTPDEKEELVEHRHAIMRKAFYPFVSGPQPQLDPQLIQQALDAWSWFWIGVEAALVFSVTGLVLIAGGVYDVGFQALAATLLLAAVALPAMRRQCERYAIAQVRAILSDPARKAAAQSAFTNLAGNRSRRRDAA